LKDRARVHLHAYTFETVSEVALYETKTVKPGESAFAQLRLNEPALLLPGDRFILRQFSPVITIGGGVVLDAAPMQRIRKEVLLPFLKVLHGGNREPAVRTRIARRGHEGLSLAQLTAETGWGRTTLVNLLADHVSRGRVFNLGERYVHGPAIEGLKLYLVGTVEDFHKQNPLVPGMSREELRETVRASADVCAATVELLVREKKLELSGDLVRLPGRGVVLKDEEAESKKTIEQAFAAAGLQVPPLDTVLAGLRVDKARAQKIVTLLLRDKVLVKLSDELVFHHSALADLRSQLAAYKTKSPPGAVARIDVTRFKEMTGVSRKYAIPLLEYLDRERVTKRVGDARVIL
jgi:selenocysteine-specific elongation factor